LDIPKSASASQIKKSYFSLCKKFHPDVNPTPTAVEKFRYLYGSRDLDLWDRRKCDTTFLRPKTEKRRLGERHWSRRWCERNEILLNYQTNLQVLAIMISSKEGVSQLSLPWPMPWPLFPYTQMRFFFMLKYWQTDHQPKVANSHSILSPPIPMTKFFEAFRGGTCSTRPPCASMNYKLQQQHFFQRNIWSIRGAE
jgi:hypothetical protein